MAKRRKKKKKGFGSGDLEHSQRANGALATAETMARAAHEHLRQRDCVETYVDLDVGSAEIGAAQAHSHARNWPEPLLKRFNKVERRLTELRREFISACLKKR